MSAIVSCYLSEGCYLEVEVNQVYRFTRIVVTSPVHDFCHYRFIILAEWFQRFQVRCLDGRIDFV